MRDYYRDCAGAGYEADPFYQRIIQACALQGQDGKIPLVPFEVLGRETAPNQRPKGLKPKPAAAISTAPSRPYCGPTGAGDLRRLLTALDKFTHSQRPRESEETKRRTGRIASA